MHDLNGSSKEPTHYITVLAKTIAAPGVGVGGKIWTNSVSSIFTDPLTESKPINNKKVIK